MARTIAYTDFERSEVPIRKLSHNCQLEEYCTWSNDTVSAKVTVYSKMGNGRKNHGNRAVVKVVHKEAVVGKAAALNSDRRITAAKAATAHNKGNARKALAKAAMARRADNTRNGMNKVAATAPKAVMADQSHRIMMVNAGLDRRAPKAMARSATARRPATAAGLRRPGAMALKA